MFLNGAQEANMITNETQESRLLPETRAALGWRRPLVVTHRGSPYPLRGIKTLPTKGTAAIVGGTEYQLHSRLDSLPSTTRKIA